jgi:hypothetical protein
VVTGSIVDLSAVGSSDFDLLHGNR